MGQSPREVVDGLLRGRGADRVALHGSPWADTLVAWVQQGYPTRLVAKQPGEERWRPDDGRMEDVEDLRRICGTGAAVVSTSDMIWSA